MPCFAPSAVPKTHDIIQTVTLSGTASGTTVFTFDSIRVIIADKKAASAFWAPHLTPGSGHDHYDLGPEVPSLLVKGPYLLRSASVSGSTLKLVGDVNGTTPLDVFAPSRVRSVTWNGRPVPVAKSPLGSLSGTISFPRALESVRTPVAADLKWVCADSLPELSADFDDSDWVVANKTSTKRPQQPTGGKVSSVTAGETIVHNP